MAAADLHGLTHIALAVRDLDRSVELDPERAGKAGGALHFDFRLTRPRAIEAALASVQAGGGRLKERGDFGAGQPWAFVEDPDGYVIELWYEDTPPHRAPAKAGAQLSGRAGSRPSPGNA